jgi:hypothetical protein
MFDRTFISTSPRSVHHSSHVTIEEKRAPTDESVKLLKDMQQKATADIIDAVHVADTSLDSVMHAVARFESDALDIRVVFSLNGKRMTAVHTFHNGSDLSPDTVREAVTKAVSVKVAEEMYRRSLTPEITHRLWRRN